MASEIVEPEVERVKISLAEENLIEQVHNYVSRLTSVVQESKNVLDDLFNQRFEIAKIRSGKIQEDIKALQDLRFGLARYATKISMSITYSSYYISLIDALTLLTNSLHNLILNLELLSGLRMALSEQLILSLQNIMDQIKHIILNVCNVLKYIVESPSRVSHYISTLQKELGGLVQTFRDIYVGQRLGESFAPIALLLNALGLVVYSVNNLGEKAICLHILRTG